MKITNFEISRDSINECFTMTVEFRGHKYDKFDKNEMDNISLAYRENYNVGIERQEAKEAADELRLHYLCQAYNIYHKLDELKIIKVIFNDPATIVFWNDGSKTVVKCGEGETFDEEKGFAIACTKKMFGNNHIYYGKMQKAIEKAVRKETDNDHFKE